MNDQSTRSELDTDVAVVGAGPAGSSVAIRLARSGFRVALIERERFPRHKLCGEFISPECLLHFRELGVLDSMLAAGGERITETHFYSRSGRATVVPSEWLGNSDGALSLSRAEMDWRMLKKARAEGVAVFEESRVTRVLSGSDGVVRGVRVKRDDGSFFDLSAALTIDAAGRGASLSKSVSATAADSKDIRFVGFKAHLEGAKIDRGRCEIYLYPGGYSGLSRVENGLANHCFLLRADIVREYIGQTNKMIEEVVFSNPRARDMLEAATVRGEWLTVAVNRFGLRDPSPAPGLVAVGDAAAFIDPFTGSGMLLAMESAALLSQIVCSRGLHVEAIGREWNSRLREHVGLRLRICGLLRRASLIPFLMPTVMAGLNTSRALRELLVRSTRRREI